MKNKTIHYLPRILAWGIVVLIIVSHIWQHLSDWINYSFFYSDIELLISEVIVLTIVASLAFLASKRPFLGGILYVMLALLPTIYIMYLIMYLFESVSVIPVEKGFSWYMSVLLMSWPYIIFLIVGILFILDSKLNNNVKSERKIKK